MRLGAIWSPPPISIQPFGSRARLSLMQAPPSCDWTAKCPADGDALGNLRIGDCVPAAMMRAVQMRRANAWDDQWKPDAAETIALYAEMTGYNPVTGTGDNGTDTVKAMTQWASKGIPTQQALDIVQWVTVAPGRSADLRLAIAHTGPVQATLALPAAAESADWSAAPGVGAGWDAGSWGLHRVLLVAYDGDWLTCRTWGQDRRMHPDFWARFALSCDCTLSWQWLDQTGLSPTGLDKALLTEDMARLAA